MAFGFGFNKQKLLGTAEKFVQQGKIQNAISEYEKILKNDPKDLTVNNTVGDLYARLGDTAKAIECFKSVGDAYAAQGFTVKGIAMYKKITKIQRRWIIETSRTLHPARPLQRRARAVPPGR
jgi:tetratricopeptide (TPR) repeat protein